MTDYVLWRQGLRGPSIARLHGTNEMDERDRRAKLCSPKPIRPEDENLGLAHLARLYPVDPAAAAEVESLTRKADAARSIANDPGATVPERAVAAQKASVLDAKAKGYTGDVCPSCANLTMVRNGTCLKCETCGGTTGCS